MRSDTAAKKASSSQINVQEERTEQKEQMDFEKTIKVTDTTRTEASSTQRIIIEFRDPPPGDDESTPNPPPGNADQNYYNYMLYLHLINRIERSHQHHRSDGIRYYRYNSTPDRAKQIDQLPTSRSDGGKQ